MTESNKPPVNSCVRVWLDEPYVSLSYEFNGIPAMQLMFRRTLVEAALVKLPDLLEGGAPDRVEILTELADMVRIVLSGGPGQVMPAWADDADDSIMGMLMGFVS